MQSLLCWDAPKVRKTPPAKQLSSDRNAGEANQERLQLNKAGSTSPNMASAKITAAKIHLRVWVL